MARIEGVTSGLMAGDVPVARKTKPVKKEQLLEYYCDACEGRLPKSRGRSLDVLLEHTEGLCVPCANFFGESGRGPGCTNMSWEEVNKRFAELREKEWGLVLRAGSFGTHNGLSVAIEPGDIFHVDRIGLAVASEEEWCSNERTKEKFTVTVNIGPVPLVLFPHEISPISFTKVLQMKQAGEIEEAYVSSNDQHGHFRPNEELRRQIYSMFGRLVNAPQDPEVEEDLEPEPQPKPITRSRKKKR